MRRILVGLILLLIAAADCGAASYAIVLRSYYGTYVCAEGGGGGVVNVDRPVPDTWETTRMDDLNGGNLTSGDYVHVRAANGMYFCAEGGGGDVVNANRTQALSWETFRIRKMNGGGSTIYWGDMVALQSLNGQWVCSDFYSRPARLRALPGPINGWQIFRLSGIANGGDYYQHYTTFYEGYCTWFAAKEFGKAAPYGGVEWSGNAGTWRDNAKARGWLCYDSPDIRSLYCPTGSLVVWKNGGVGHVAVVHSVASNGITIDEMNWGATWIDKPKSKTDRFGYVDRRFLTWAQVALRGSYRFSGYVIPWR